MNRSWLSLARRSALAGALLLGAATTAHADHNRPVSVVVSTPGFYTAFSTGPHYYPPYGYYAPPPVYTPGYWSWNPPQVYYPRGYRGHDRWDDHPRHHAKYRGEKRGWDKHDRRRDDRDGRDGRYGRDWRDHDD